MNSHKNARLTPLGRAHMIKQIGRIGLPCAAEQAGISPRRAREWLRRHNELGEDGLYDRPSRPHRHPQSIAPDKHERIVNLRRNHRLIYAEIAMRTGVSVATVGRICTKAGVARLPPMEEAPPVRRYERKTPGELLHLDTKKLARFHRPGHRVTGDVSRHSKKPGYQALHVAIDDHSRVGFSLVLPDETIKSVIAFVLAALRYYRALGVRVSRIMTDNGSPYRSKKFAKLLEMVRRYAHLSTVHLADYVNRRQELRGVSVTVKGKGAKQTCLTP